MKDQIITNKILNWYDINKRSLPWRKKTSSKKTAAKKKPAKAPAKKKTKVPAKKKTAKK